MMELGNSNGLGFVQEGYGEIGVPAPRQQAEVDPLIRRHDIIESWRQGYDLGDTALCEQAEEAMDRLFADHPELADSVSNNQ